MRNFAERKPRSHYSGASDQASDVPAAELRILAVKLNLQKLVL
jgi:hypothetical protein